MKTIAIANQKGGVGKTTTSVNLAAGLTKLGKKVCCLDFDPQCHLGKYLGFVPDNGLTISDCIFSKINYADFPDTSNLIRHSESGVDFIPASLRLSRVEIMMGQTMFRERILRDLLKVIVPADTYDYLIIDCNPSMGILLTNALVAAQYVLIPVQTEEFSIDGLRDMQELIAMIKANINPELSIIGLLPTLTTRTTGSREVVSMLHSKYKETLDTEIGRYAAAPKSVTERKPLVNGNSKLASQYMAATQEILARLEN